MIGHDGIVKISFNDALVTKEHPTWRYNDSRTLSFSSEIKPNGALNKNRPTLDCPIIIRSDSRTNKRPLGLSSLGLCCLLDRERSCHPGSLASSREAREKECGKQVQVTDSLMLMANVLTGGLFGELETVKISRPIQFNQTRSGSNPGPGLFF